MRYAKKSFSVAELNWKMYLAGGYMMDEGKIDIISSVECYKMETNQWFAAPNMNKARSILAFVKSNDYIFAMGGDKILERYGAARNEWTIVCKNITERLIL